MKRRNFILLSAAGITAVGIPVWYFNFYKDGKLNADKPAALSMIWNNETLHKIGKEYRMLVREEDDRSRLENLLGGNDTANIEKLKKSISQDFSTGNTVQLDGWILAITEARQCALFSLTHQTS